MSDQTLDLRRSLQIIRRHLAVVGILTAVGCIAGAGYTVRSPPLLTSNALVVLSTTSGTTTATQVVIASSDPVLQGALPRLGPSMSVQILANRMKVTSLAPGVLSISAKGKTAAQAERAANAVADSYIAYLRGNSAAVGQLQANLEQRATTATGPSLLVRIFVTAVLGALVGALIGAIGVLIVGRGDRRLRQRDEIADAIGVPVLASVPVWHPSNAARWSNLLADYRPSAAHAWRLRGALRYLGMPDPSAKAGNGRGYSLTVLSISSDRRALALGPQLAVFAAALGFSTALVIGPEQGTTFTATLRAACGARSISPRRSANLRVSVADHGKLDQRTDAMLTVVVAVVDGRTPRMAETIHTNVTVLGVSSGAATAEQLARIAVWAAADGRQIDAILVADPDPADPTTGRMPQMARPAHRAQPTRVAGLTREARR
jgi:capsular polysaccharide biosynthesis protein